MSLALHYNNYITEVTEQVTWLDSQKMLTNRYKEHIYTAVKSLTVEQVSRSENLGGKNVQKIFN